MGTRCIFNTRQQSNYRPWHQNKTSQCLDFLHLNLKTNQKVFKRKTPYFLPGHVFMQNLCSISQEETTDLTVPASPSEHTGLVGGEGVSKLSWWWGVHSLFLPPRMLIRQFPHPTESTHTTQPLPRRMCGFHLGQIRKPRTQDTQLYSNKAGTVLQPSPAFSYFR